MRREVVLDAAALAAAVAVTGCGGGETSSPSSGSAVATSFPMSSTNPGLALLDLFVQMVKNVSPSVVQIETNAGPVQGSSTTTKATS